MIDNEVIKKCAACIVLYNPEVKRLIENIDAIFRQVDKVYCYDNASSNIAEFENLIRNYPNCALIKGKNNIGIASAINQVCDDAKFEGYTWMLTLDQDSVCPNNMITCFSKYFDRENVGIICPRYIDSRRPAEKICDNDELSEVDFCITSGSLMNIEIFYKVGKMDDYLFVGSVDDEYCYRLVQNGFRILQLNSVAINHELGVLTPSKYSGFFLGIGKILHSSKIQALSYKREVSPIRVYYATRNIVYLSKKYKSHPYKFSKRFAIFNGISSIVRGKNKIKIMNSFFRGFKEGILT